MFGLCTSVINTKSTLKSIAKADFRTKKKRTIKLCFVFSIYSGKWKVLLQSFCYPLEHFYEYTIRYVHVVNKEPPNAYWQIPNDFSAPDKSRPIQFVATLWIMNTIQLRLSSDQIENIKYDRVAARCGDEDSTHCTQYNLFLSPSTLIYTRIHSPHWNTMLDQA